MRFFMDFKIGYPPPSGLSEVHCSVPPGHREACLVGSGSGSNKHPINRWQYSHFTLLLMLSEREHEDQCNEPGKDVKNESSQKDLKICHQHWPRAELWNMKIHIYIWCLQPPFLFHLFPYILTSRLFIPHTISLSWVSFLDSSYSWSLSQIWSLLQNI